MHNIEEKWRCGTLPLHNNFIYLTDTTILCLITAFWIRGFWIRGNLQQLQDIKLSWIAGSTWVNRSSSGLCSIYSGVWIVRHVVSPKSANSSVWPGSLKLLDISSSPCGSLQFCRICFVPKYVMGYLLLCTSSSVQIHVSCGESGQSGDIKGDLIMPGNSTEAESASGFFHSVWRPWTLSASVQ